MLIGQKVRLRALERADLPNCTRWMNDPEVRQYLLVFEPMSQAKEEEWYERLLRASDECVFAIDVLHAQEWAHIGTTGLLRIDFKNRTAVFGIVIGERSEWGRGHGTEATHLLLEYAFHELNLHRVELEVFDYNARAIRSYEKAGFKKEGIRRQAFYHDGSYHDVHVMGILREEFQVVR